MKKLFVLLAGAVAFGDHAVAADCPPGKQIYSFKPSGKQFKIGMPPAKYKYWAGGESTGYCCYKDICCFIRLGDVKDSGKTKVIRAEGGSYLRLSDIDPKSVKEGAELYRAETRCRK